MSSIHMKRKIGDLKKLKDSGLRVEFDDEDIDTIYVCIEGPKETNYEGGFFWLRMMITKDYPFKSPSVIFLTPIFHPNIEYESGSICLDAINEQWTPVFNFERIFSIMIPQLLSYPNPNDPFHIYAAELLMKDAEKYNEIAKYINQRFATTLVQNPKNLVARDMMFL
jgi:ubiquitin-conjugating enzyme E2 H